MIRSLCVVSALAIGVSFAAPAFAVNERALPMRFELKQDGPSDTCATTCRTWISATGLISADTPRDFLEFARDRNLRGATVALDSDGGSVLGAIALGRQFRNLDLVTTVGKTVDLDTATGKKTILLPAADCESMCTFLLLAGVKRVVPQEARVQVHQIWLGDRRDDPTAANYSAEDLVLVQRDIGRLAAYTAEMGGSVELLDLALRIPPWEPMYVLNRDELRRMRLDTSTDAVLPQSPAAVSAAPAASTTATAAIAPVHPAATPVANTVSAAPVNTGAIRIAAISKRGWSVIDNSGAAALARRHPLTVEGETIGSFDLVLTCGDSDGYRVSYQERRTERGGELPPLREVVLQAGGTSVTLTVVSSERGLRELETSATGFLPAPMLKGFANSLGRSITVKTVNGERATSIRLGNTGAPQFMPQLASACTTKPNGTSRASLPQGKTASASPAQ